MMDANALDLEGRRDFDSCTDQDSNEDIEVELGEEQGEQGHEAHGSQHG